MDTEETPPAEKPAKEATKTEPLHHEPPTHKSASFGMGFFIGIGFSLLLAAYPLYTALESKQSKNESLGQNVLDTLQMQITVVHTELESIDRQLAMIAEAEKKYSQLLEQKFDLETNRQHLETRLQKLEEALTKVEQETGLTANQFDKITSSMRLD